MAITGLPAWDIVLRGSMQPEMLLILSYSLHLRPTPVRWSREVSEKAACSIKRTQYFLVDLKPRPIAQAANCIIYHSGLAEEVKIVIDL